MKTIPAIILITSLSTSRLLLAAEPPAGDPPVGDPPTSEVLNSTATNAPASGDTNSPAAADAPADDAAPPPPPTLTIPGETGTGGLRLNFRGAPLNLVLDYLSDAAGFIINKETEVSGKVDVWSKDSVSKDEAVELLNSVLRKNGYAVIRNGRILNIVSMESAKTSDLDVVSGNKWENVEGSDEVINQIIPVRYANATQLMNNLQILLPTSATLSVNESANSLILVATKRDIRRMLKIVSALDTSIANVSSIKVFPLRYADAKQLATVVQQLFAPQTGQGAGNNPRAQLFNMFRGGGGPGGGTGGAGGAGGGSSGGGAGAKVTASADEYSNSLIVSASTELMATISDMVQQIDQATTDVTELRVFTLVNADPTEIADQLGQLFPDDTKSGQSQNQNFGFRFAGGPGGGGSRSAAASSDRMKKKSRVLAVPDPRTSSVMVSAASEMMPQIAQMIAQLDSSPAKREVVTVRDLQNADPQDVYQVLQDLFQRSGNIRANNTANRNSMLGQNNPLSSRATQLQQNSSTASSRFGNSSRTGSAGGF